MYQEENGKWRGIGFGCICHHDQVVTAASAGFIYPDRMIEMWQLGKYSDLGHVAIAMGAPEKDADWVVTKGKWRRRRFTIETLSMCLAQLDLQ